MILTVANTKGGVGKTTLAVQIAIQRAQAGREVWLIDGDRQGSAAASIGKRAEKGLTPGVACAKYDVGKELRAQVQQQRAKWDDIIIDVGGVDSTAMRAALALTDVVLVPFAPRTYEVWALDDMAKLIDNVNAERDGLRAYAVMNRAEAGGNSNDNREAAEMVGEMSQFAYLATPIAARKAVAVASAEGQSLTELTRRDPKAEAELNRLIEELF